jgi:hypothetical protein
MNGTVERYLLSGSHSEVCVRLLIEDWTLIAAINVETGEEIETSHVGGEDIEKAIEFLTTSKTYYGN